MMNDKKEEIIYWSLPIKKVFESLHSSEQGLSTSEANKKIDQFGENIIKEKTQHHGVKIFLSQFKSPFILILIAASIIAYFLHEKTDAVIILVIILLSSVLSFFQEYRAEKVMRMLRSYVSHKAKVVRDGELVEIDAKYLVSGDIIKLNIGDVIPADVRLINVEEMSTDESALTGESSPIIKKISVVSEKHALPQYLYNIAFSGTTVASGSGKGIVIATGKNTFFGRTASSLMQKMPEADFQKGIKDFSNFILKVVVILTAVVFASNALLGKGIFGSFMFAVALAVGITPELLPMIMTVALSSGSLNMAKEKVITKRLASIEDFGNIDILCCDKTGTLTEGRLVLQQYLTIDGTKDRKLLFYGLLCNPARENKGKGIEGNSVDKAIWQNKEAKTLQNKVEQVVVLDENEFDFERRRMSIVLKGEKKNIFIVKGAPESVLEKSTKILVNGKKRKLSKIVFDKIKKQIAEYEGEGYKVIAIAEKETAKKETKKSDEKELTFLGFLNLLDPPKKTAKKSLKLLQELGIGIKVLSGDSPLITRKICSEVGLMINEDKIITGEEIENLDDKQLFEIAQKYNVFARITPEHKYKIVASLNKEGHVVGFLGDGINDAPALKAADVGISIDSAVPIAKEAADIILLKKSLRVVAKGVVLGRKTFGNITKYILNTISANYGNMFTVVVASLFLPFIPLLAAQILLINFISDFPLLTLSTDKVDDEFVKKPKRWNIKLISKFMIHFGLISSFFDLALICTLFFVFKTSPELFRTSWFVLSILTEVIITFSIRTRFFFMKSRPSNALLFSSLFAVIITLALPFTIFGNKFFKFVPIPLTIVVFIGILIAVYFIVVEVTKQYFFRKFET